MTPTIRRWIASAQGLRQAMNLFGPYMGAGVRISDIADDFSSATVAMDLHWYNRNYVGTHFGGSLYSMVDPMYMLLLMRRLGHGYTVWDKSASIDFVSPGRGKVSAHFELTDQRVGEIKAAAAGGDKVLPEWDIDIVDQQGKLVACVHKVLYVREKRGPGICAPVATSAPA
ncbi:DUF4442 domain-containing protein [Marinobacter caseinilyticus]|uniref:DUF4442 domain-containing protein n=1 Tax=Marinobacter caseinilyticus TaxID=2692195 RepID=UPI00140B77B1|nr:DUF4442 domain-containing protein [Marinobacter caseinilyticus]